MKISEKNLAEYLNETIRSTTGMNCKTNKEIYKNQSELRFNIIILITNTRKLMNFIFSSSIKDKND